ncbi:MAG: RluA family pseudouridine synthase [Rhodospirillaceae bacterium]
MSETREIIVPDDRAGERLDKALADLSPDLSRARVQALLAGGLVADASGRPVAEAKRKVRAGDRFVLTVPAPAPAKPQAQAMDLDIVYEDSELIVVNKPKGLVVHPAAGNPDRTLVNALIAHCGAGLSGIGGEMRPGIVHRLDKDTSGLLVAAKTDAAHQSLSKQFAEHSIERAYLAVVWGVPKPLRDDIEGNIGRDPKNRKRMAVRVRGGKPAKTAYRVIEAFGDQAALVECRLATGRTHQIRVHTASIGHPVIGDPMYGGRRGRQYASALVGRTVRKTAEDAGLILPETQALHAYKLGFHHHLTGEDLHFESKSTREISNLCDFFRSL